MCVYMPIYVCPHYACMGLFIRLHCESSVLSWNIIFQMVTTGNTRLQHVDVWQLHAVMYNKEIGRIMLPYADNLTGYTPTFWSVAPACCDIDVKICGIRCFPMQII